MKNTKEKIQVLIEAIDELISINKPDTDDEMVYDIVFQMHSGVISPMLECLGLKFDWYDPDTSYREDVDAYLIALKDFRNNLAIMLV